jgi:hypothetical protein
MRLLLILDRQTNGRRTIRVVVETVVTGTADEAIIYPQLLL